MNRFHDFPDLRKILSLFITLVYVTVKGIKLIRNLHKNTNRRNNENYPAYILVKNRRVFTAEFVHIHSLFLHKFKHCLFRRNRRDSTSLLHTQSGNCISHNSTLSDFFPFHLFYGLIYRKDTA